MSSSYQELKRDPQDLVLNHKGTPAQELKRDPHDRYLKRKRKKKKLNIKKAIKHPGALHKNLHVPPGKKIPPGKLHAAEGSSNKKIAQRARFAALLQRMHQ